MTAADWSNAWANATVTALAWVAARGRSTAMPSKGTLGLFARVARSRAGCGGPGSGCPAGAAGRRVGRMVHARWLVGLVVSRCLAGCGQMSSGADTNCWLTCRGPGLWWTWRLSTELTDGEGLTAVSGRRKGIAALPAPSEPHVRVSPHTAQAIPPALARSTASAALGGTNGGRDAGSCLRWWGRGAPRCWRCRTARGLDRGVSWCLRALIDRELLSH